MQNILVVADLTNKDPVALKALDELADLYKKDLHVVFFCYQELTYLQGDVKAMQQTIMHNLQVQADELINTHAHSASNITYEVVWALNIHEWINEYVQVHQPLMVVKTGHRSESTFYTPSDWQLIRQCQAPVYILAERKWRRSSHVMATVDLKTQRPSKQALNHQVLRHAKALADAKGCELHVCYVVVCSTLLQDLGIQYSDEIEREAQRTQAECVAELCKQYDVPTANFHIVAGEPDKVITSTAAEHHVGTVVVGTVGRKKLSGMLIGNTAEKIFALLKTDVLAIKPEHE